MKIKAELESLPKVLAWVRAQVEETNLSEGEKKRVEIALEEAVVNVMMHGAKESEIEIELSCKHEPDRHIEFELKDLGPPFNPIAHEGQTQSDSSLEERELGGLGLSIMRKYMDTLLYRREGDQNILILIKTIQR